MYDKLIKHFDRLGFPQPISSRQSEVGVIREWRFMAGNAPSPTVDVEKADKNIGEGFGRVVHWLLCSADMMPSGEAVIVYYDQHIEFVRWIGSRMGFCVLSAATELDWTGNHVQLDPRLRAIANTWLIIMPSARAKATRRASAAQWEHTHMKVGDRVPVATQTNPSFAPQPPMPSPEAQGTVRKPSLTSQNSQSKLPPAAPQLSAKDIPIRKKSNGKTIEQRLDDVERDFNNVLLPQCTKLLTAPPADAKIRAREFEKLTKHIEKAVIYWLDGFPIPQDHPARSRKKAMIVHAQRTLDALEAASKFVPNHEHVSAVELTGSATTPTMPIPPAPTSVSLPLKASQSQLSAPPAPTTLPPPYSPSSSQTLPSSTTHTTAPIPEKPPTKNVIRRKAPPPPRRAKALYHFEPDDGNDEELAFKEGDTIDVMTNSADATELEEQGWCKARVKGTRKIGLVPLEYIEIEQKAAAAVQAAPLSQTSNLGSTTSFQAGSMDVLDSTAGYASPVAYTPLSPNLMYSTADATAPQTITNYTVVENYKSQSSNSIEAAGLGVVAGGTTAGVTSVIQDDYQSGGNGGAQPMDQSLQQSEEAIDSNQSFVSNILIQNEQNAPVEMPQNENSENFNVITAAPPLPPTLDDTDSPGPAIDLSAFSMPPFDPRPVSPGPNPPTFESNPIAALASVDPYFAAQNPGLANAPDFDSAMAATQQQDSGLSTYGVTSPFTSVATTQDQSASDPDMYAAASPITPMTTVVPPTAVPAPDAYLDPVTSPPGSPLPAAGEEIASVVVLSETSTGDAAGDYVEVNTAAEVTEGFDDEYC